MADEPVKIESIEKITRILDALKKLDQGGVTELSQYTGIPKSTMYYYLTTLERNEYIVKEGKNTPSVSSFWNSERRRVNTVSCTMSQSRKWTI